jgi:hypothetical protein
MSTSPARPLPRTDSPTAVRRTGHRFGAARARPVLSTLAVRGPAPVAQRIEHLTTDQEVGGSNPFGRASWRGRRRRRPCPPPALDVGPDPVTVGAPHVALLDLGLDPGEADSLASQDRDGAELGRPVTVVELQDADVVVPAVDARTLPEVDQQPRPRLLHHPLGTATRLGQVVVAVGPVVSPARPRGGSPDSGSRDPGSPPPGGSRRSTDRSCCLGQRRRPHRRPCRLRADPPGRPGQIAPGGLGRKGGPGRARGGTTGSARTRVPSGGGPP